MSTFTHFPQCSFHEIVRMRAGRQERAGSDTTLLWAVIALFAVVLVMVLS